MLGMCYHSKFSDAHANELPMPVNAIADAGVQTPDAVTPQP